MTPFPKQPTFYTKDRLPVNMVDQYFGLSAFLICSGPSINSIDKSLLYKPGVFRMGVNNSPAIVRPHFWTFVDGPHKFLKSVWFDPTILKFCPWKHRNSKLWDSYNQVELHEAPVNTARTLFYDWDLGFNPSTWITQEKFIWGNNEKDKFLFEGEERKGGRSCMMVALKLLITLGFRRIFLVGCDFNMQKDQPYAFEQGKSSGACKGNNKSYEKLDRYFRALQPEFQKFGIKIFNTYEHSGLTAFPYMNYYEAIREVTAQVGDPDTETTAGMYDSLDAKRKRAASGVYAGRTTYEGVWKPENNKVNKTRMEPSSRRLKPSDLLKIESQLCVVDPSFQTPIRVAKERRDMFRKQGNLATGNEEEVMMPLVNFFTKKFLDSPESFKNIVNLNLESTLLVGNEERTLGSFY